MIYLAADHAGFALKALLKKNLEELGHEVKDLGAFEQRDDDDYPQIIAKAAEAVAEDPNVHKGIVIGGSGIGEAIVANKFEGVRCALFYGPVVAKSGIDVDNQPSDDPYAIVKLSRQHNNSNMLSIGARFVSDEEARQAVTVWLETPFSTDPRHQKRVQQINGLE